MKLIRFGFLALLSIVLLLGSTGCPNSEKEPQDESPANTTDVTAPSAPSDVARTTPDTDLTPTFTWSPANDADSGMAYYLVRIDSDTWVNITNVTSHTHLTPLAEGSHTFEVKAVDTAHNHGPATSLDFVCIGVDTASLSISGISIINKSASGATVTWTTNEPATSQVEYGTTASYGSSSVLDSDLVTTHTVNLTGLIPDTTYHYRVISADASNNEAISADNSFTTLAVADITAPVISSVASTATTSGATITWNTDEASTSQVEYGLSTGYGSVTTLDMDLETAHSVPLTGLSAATTYHYRVKSKDASNNEAISGDLTFTTSTLPDGTAPVISGIGSSNITTSSATISWTTNEPATSEVEYGLTTTYSYSTTLDSTLVTSHAVLLTSLTANVTYHFRVKSRDAAGNEAASGDFSFSMPDTLSPTISSVGLSDLAAHGATVVWATNEPSTSRVHYGLTTACELSTVLDASLVLSHSMVLNGLSAETTYYFRVRSIDISGNEAVSGLYYFVTPTCPDLGNWVDTYYYCYGELPLVPTWMIVAEGYNTGGRVHPGMTMGIPSMQWWNSLSPSQQQQVLELVDWLDRNPP